MRWICYNIGIQRKEYEMPTAHIVPHYGRYGKDGYTVIAKGFTTFFAATLKVAKEWCELHGFDGIRV